MRPDAPGCVAPARQFPTELSQSSAVSTNPGNAGESSVPAVRPPMPDEPPSEFQQFVEASTGKHLPHFGYSLFDSVPSTFAPVDRIPVTADYVIGPGDEVLVRAWGQIDLDARLVVDRAGEVYLPKVGVLRLAGLRYEQLQEYVKSSVGKIFRNFDLTVNLGQLRSIQVLVVGQARRPGSYTVSSLSTLVSALFASGGPSRRGSMRHIQLKRENRIVSEFDVYELLLKGDKSKDLRLLPGDVIYIPPIGPLVAMSGSVNVPGIYELASETTLREQIEIAGGLTNTADGQKARLERIDGHNTRTVQEFSLEGEGLSQRLRDGDLVRISPISPRFENAITLRGNVAQPGRYPFKAGMRVRDLIPNVEFLLTREFWTRQNEVEESSDYIPTLNESTMRNELRRTANDINWDYAVIQRIDHANLSTMLIPFNLGKAIIDANDKENLSLESGDIVTVFSHNDLSVPVEKRTTLVRLEGEFRSPGVYRAEPGETLTALIARAGGLTEKAYFFGAEFTRESTRLLQQSALDEMVRRMERQLQSTMMTTADTRSEQAAAALQMQMQTRQSMIEKLRQMRATGRVVLQSKPSEGLAVLPELVLEDNDRLYVPARPQTVSVVGEVHNQSSFVYKPHQRLGRYLKLAGHGTQDADLGRMFVLRANGEVVSKAANNGLWRGSFESSQLLPGDVLVVPARMEKGNTIRTLKDWSQIVGQFGLGIAAINVLR